MYVRYRISASTTAADVLNDITGIIGGTITAASGLSTNAQANSTFSGSYPSGTIYAVSYTNSSTASVISKKHNSASSYTSYILLNASSDTTGLGVGINTSTSALGKDWSSGATITNSATMYANKPAFLKPYYSTTNIPHELIIILTNKSLVLIQPAHGTCIGWVDITSNGVVEKYTTSMRTVMCDFVNSQAKVPYTYKLNGTSSGYGTTTYTGIYNTAGSVPGSSLVPGGSFLTLDENNYPVIIENPSYIRSPDAGGYVNFLYGVVSLAPGVLSSKTIYNTSGVTRITYGNYAFLTE
jgi:hypothetical protein